MPKSSETTKPTLAPPRPPAPAAGTPNQPTKTSGNTGIQPPNDTGTITVRVPVDAEVTINGLKTTAVGSERVYRSYNLKPGFSYDYRIHVQVTRNGTLLEKVSELRLISGGTEALAVDFTPPTERLARAR